MNVIVLLSGDQGIVSLSLVISLGPSIAAKFAAIDDAIAYFPGRGGRMTAMEHVTISAAVKSTVVLKSQIP